MPEMLPDTEELIVEEDSQPADFEAATEPTTRNVLARSSDPTLKDLYDRYRDGDLILQPDFQRQFVWDVKKSCRLIESALLDVPLPVVYLAEEADGRESVIDGQQRLTSFFDFLDGKWALSGLDVRVDLNGKRFSELDRVHRNKIRRTAIRVTTVLKESDENLKFEIFERLNTGSVALNDQELRNCIYRGRYNDLLKKMATDQDFMSLLGLQKPEKRMRDVELVLRFAAFFHATPAGYRAPMRRFLNDDIRRFQNIRDTDAIEIFRAFRDSVQIIQLMLGKYAFKRFRHGPEDNLEGNWEKRFNASLYDVLMYGFTRYNKNQVIPRLVQIREALIQLMTNDDEFIAAIETSTSSTKNVRTRFEKWLQTLERIIGQPRAQEQAAGQRF